MSLDALSYYIILYRDNLKYGVQISIPLPIIPNEILLSAAAFSLRLAREACHKVVAGIRILL